MRKGGCGRCVEEAMEDVWRRLWEMCKGGCGRCIDLLGKLSMYNTLEYAI